MTEEPAKKSLRVLKFGGTSVGSADRLRRAIDIAAHEASLGPIAVVVSAMGDTTDWLIRAAELAAAGDRDEAEGVFLEVCSLAKDNATRVATLLGHEADGPTFVLEIDRILAPLRRLLDGMSFVREKTPQMLDSVMSFGEHLSATIVAGLLGSHGLDASFVDAREWTVTDASFGSALVDWALTEAKAREVFGRTGVGVAVTTGFLGRTTDGRTTTLGRNGSDYTAALLARALGAAEVQIWTDVAGVMSADPGLVDDARPLARLSYTEALELANFGARMFHPRTMIPLIEAQIPLRIRNTSERDAPGTLVDATGAADERRATSVTSLENLALLEVGYRRISMRGSLSGRVLAAVDRASVTVWMATHSAHGQGVALVIPEAQIDRALEAILSELALDLARGEIDPPRVRRPMTLITLVAEAMGQTPGVAGRFFQALGSQGINVFASGQGASSRSVSCAVDASDTALAVRTVHTSFHFAHQRVSLFVLGKGTVGAELLSQIASETERLDRDHEVALRLVGIADSRRVAFEPAGLPLPDWRHALDAAEVCEGDAANRARIAVLDRLRSMPVPVLVDLTAASGLEQLYEEAFARGIHVVAANKKPLSEELSKHESLMRSAKKHHRSFAYETTVGASLPVIGTLKDLIRTGDRIVRIEGSFSGTLGYLTNELMSEVPLSRAVARARDLGYAEPAPQDDLSGLDVARKALILGREIGLTLEPSDVRIEPFVAAELLAIRNVDRFLAALAEHDAAMAERVARAKSDGQALRYLARIEPDPSGPRIFVGPVLVPLDHPAASLRGAEAFVAFSTARYSEYPLIVRGAGAGGAVTAAGVLADILEVAQRARGA